MEKNKKISFGLIVGAVAVIILFFTTMPMAGSKELSVKEIKQNEAEYINEFLMTSGSLVDDSVNWNSDELLLRFDLFEKDAPDEVLQVQYAGVKPDNFSDDVIVIVEGVLNREGVFEAEKVQTKCPSKYEGEDYDDHVDDYDLETHTITPKEKTGL